MNVSPLAAAFRISQAEVILSAARPVRSQLCDVTAPVPPHDHEYHEVGLVLSGRGVHVTETGEQPLTEGSLFLIPPGQVHSIRPDGPMRIINAYYLAEWLAEDLEALWDEPGAVALFLEGTVLRSPREGRRQIEIAEPGPLATELLAIEREWSAAAASRLLLRAMFLKVVSLAARHWRAADASVLCLQFRPAVWSEIARIETAVNAGLIYSVAEGMEESDLSADYLSSLFRRQTGMSRSDYYQRRRVHRACQLLLSPRRSVTEIALDLGYTDAPHFCRLFRRHRGLSPRAYRQRYSVGRGPGP